MTRMTLLAGVPESWNTHDFSLGRSISTYLLLQSISFTMGDDMRILILTSIFAILVGCAGMLDTGIPSPEETQLAIDNQFAGKTIASAVVRYGVPNGKFNTTKPSYVVYLWERDAKNTTYRSQTMTTSGSVGNSWEQSVPYTSTTSYRSPETKEYHCVLHFVVNQHGTIMEGGVNGKMFACQHFMP